nr:MAG TPA_asm: hypothetical protein [Caudoviricetes sp.]
MCRNEKSTYNEVLLLTGLSDEIYVTIYIYSYFMLQSNSNRGQQGCQRLKITINQHVIK